MAGTSYGSFAVGDANLDNLMLQTAAVERGHCALTLTEMTTTTIPQIAAGSRIEINGTLFKFDANDTIGGSASTGTNYIYITSAGVATWTTTNPTWFDSKQGWYNSSGNSRYIPYKVVLSGSSYYKLMPMTERGLIGLGAEDATTNATELQTARITSLQLGNGAYDGTCISFTSALTSPASFYLKHPVSAMVRHTYVDTSEIPSISLTFNPPGTGANARVFSFLRNDAPETRYIALNPGNYILTWESGQYFYAAYPHGVYKNYTLSDIIS